MTTLCQSVSSFHSPVCWSFQRRLVAIVNVDRALPLGVNLVSASLPRLPTSMTLLTLRDAILSELYHIDARYFAESPGAGPAAVVRQDVTSARASSFGKYGVTVSRARSKSWRDVSHEPDATAAR